MACHYPISCSKCKQTHVLAAKPAISGESARIRCQQCHVQVRVSKCTCVVCGNFVAKCRCSMHGPAPVPRQRSIRVLLGGGGRASSCSLAGGPVLPGQGAGISAQGLSRRLASSPMRS